MIIKKQIRNFILHLINVLDKDSTRFYEVGLETRNENEFVLHVIMVSGLVTGILIRPNDKDLFVKIFDFITGL